MTDRERIMRAIRGEPVDRLPWAPRLEFWYRARRRNGTLPEGLGGLSLSEIIRKLGMAHYAVVPDFTELSEENDMVDRAIGVLQAPGVIHRTTLQEVDRVVRRDGRQTVVEYRTPVGSVRTTTLMTEEMLDAGASVEWVSEHAVKTPQDMKVAAHIFSRLRVEPRYEDFAAWEAQVGDRGVAVAYTGTAACAMHHILKELMPTEQFFFAQHDEPALIDELAEAVEHWYAGIRRVAAESPAEVILLGANYDDSITSPPFFRKYILPALRSYADELHARGKFLLTHTDGENRRLMPLYLEAGFDIADSVCPAPMTRLTFEDFWRAFAGRIAIWGGIPSVLFCDGSATFDQFKKTVDDMLARYGGETRWIVGVSDMVTADAELDRLRYITEKMCG